MGHHSAFGQVSALSLSWWSSQFCIQNRFTVNRSKLGAQGCSERLLICTSLRSSHWLILFNARRISKRFLCKRNWKKAFALLNSKGGIELSENWLRKYSTWAQGSKSWNYIRQKWKALWGTVYSQNATERYRDPWKKFTCYSEISKIFIGRSRTLFNVEICGLPLWNGFALKWRIDESDQGYLFYRWQLVGKQFLAAYYLSEIMHLDASSSSCISPPS